MGRDKVVSFRNSVESESQHAALPDGTRFRDESLHCRPVQANASAVFRYEPLKKRLEDQWSAIALSAVCS